MSFIASFHIDAVAAAWGMFSMLVTVKYAFSKETYRGTYLKPLRGMQHYPPNNTDVISYTTSRHIRATEALPWSSEVH